jgi:hypothetical protein
MGCCYLPVFKKVLTYTHDGLLRILQLPHTHDGFLFIFTHDGSHAPPLHARQFREFALVRRIKTLNPTHEARLRRRDHLGRRRHNLSGFGNTFPNQVLIRKKPEEPSRNLQSPGTSSRH